MNDTGEVLDKCQLLLVQRTGLVIAYCRTNHHTFSTLKQAIFLTFQHPWVRNPGAAYLSPVLQGLSEAPIKVSTRPGFASKDSPREGLPPSSWVLPERLD